MRGIIAGSLTAPALCGPAFAGPTVAGNVADRGISAGDGNTGNFADTRKADSTSQHSAIELSIERGIFVGATALGIYWSPSRGNDVLEINDDLLPARVPEPGTPTVLAAGLLGVGWARRRG